VRKAKVQTENTVNAILRAGQLVDGKYRVDRLIGEGGMAAVWAGTNERTGKRVALKVILRSLAKTAEAQNLFHSEVLAASRINHPNVVSVFDVIEHEGMPCIVMELLDGEPLGSYLAFRGFLTVGEATTVLLPAMRGVAAAHGQGVIHRDLKPQNIFICIGPDGRVVTTKVLDFGISVMVERVVDRSAGPSSALSMGTPAYMSPEQLLGWARIDERADVYGFGVLLYESLTGEMPFPGQPGPELFHRIVNDSPPPVTQFHPELPPGLVRIIEKAMAKKPGDRFANLNLMLGSIEDELAPSTPVPRLSTPSTGVPAHALRDVLSVNSNSVVEAIVKQEPSGQFQETQLFIARPTEKDIPVVPFDEQAGSGLNQGAAAAAPPPPVDEPAGSGLNQGVAVAASPPPAEPEKAGSLLNDWPTTAPVSSLGRRSVFRHWRWFVGVGSTVVPIVALWIAARSTGDDQHPAPARTVNTASAMKTSPVPLAVPAVLPAASSPTVAVPAAVPAASSPTVAVPAAVPAASSPTVAIPAAVPAASSPTVAVPAAVPAATRPIVAVPAPLPASPLPIKPGAPATAEHGKSARHVHDVPVAANAHRSHVAARDSVSPGRHAAHSALDQGTPALATPPAAMAGSSAKPAPAAPAASSPAKPRSRAGGLSADDF
jgi:serine/threonine-protein kinase